MGKARRLVALIREKEFIFGLGATFVAILGVTSAVLSITGIQFHIGVALFVIATALAAAILFHFRGLVAPQVAVDDLKLAGEGEHVFTTIIRLMVVTGMRVGELCKLGLDDLSPDCAVVRIHGKGARERVAYITDASLRQDLQQTVQQRRKSQASISALFVNRHGARMRPQSVRSKLRQLAKEAGLSRPVTPHMLRHTAATLPIETGVDIRFVQRLLGHSSIATTEIYTHVSDQALRTTLERADVLGTLTAI